MNWELPANVLMNRFRAFNPWPGTFTFIPTGTKHGMLKIWEMEPAENSATPGTVISADKAGIVVACGQQALRILAVQPEGGRRMDTAQYLAGHSLKAGASLL